MKATGSAKAEDVRGHLRGRPFEDFLARDARLLPNGRLVHDMLTVRIEASSEQRRPRNCREIPDVVRAADAFRPIGQSKRRSMF